MKIKALMGFVGVGIITLASCSQAATSTSSNMNTTTGSTVTTTTVGAPTTTDAPTTTTTTEVVPTTTTQTEVEPTTTTTGVTPTTSSSKINTDGDTTIFLAGDSTVKTYTEKQYIGGWGQYLDLFLGDNVTVKNCAQGGRSSRSFINEGRLFDIENSTYTFSENGGNSIGDEIKIGDYLFIQFGHNDDDTKAANSLAERMVPLGEPVNGIYPTTAGEKTTIVKNSGVATLDSVSDEVKEKMSSYTSNLNTYLTNSVSKYGDSYYEYSSGGTYKWFLKQYIDFAREKGATPVLVTPVARVSYNSDGTLKSGPGLHGDNFAYVTAVRQLAEEEECLLIDLFADTKEMLETITSSEAYHIMALKDSSGGNGNSGDWPSGFDTEYATATKESTHYNKFGAFITAGKVAEHLKSFIANDTKGKDDESITFKDSVNENPETYIVPSNLMHKATATKLYNLFETVNVKDPDYQYPDPSIVTNAITKLVADYPNVTQENYLQVKEECEKIRASFVLINVDDVESVTNINDLVDYEAEVAELVKANRPVATEVIVFDPSDLIEAVSAKIASTVDLDGFKIVGASGKEITVMAGASFTYNDVAYTTTKSLSMGGSATFGTNRYIQFTTTKTASITLVAKSTSASADRIAKMVDSSKNDVASFAANGALSITTKEDIQAGTYMVGSAGSGIYVYAIIIEYFD